MAACARPVPPSGGPEDKTPPFLVSVQPESLATGVALDSEIVLEFSEAIDKESLLKSLWISPPRVPKNVSVSGKTARIKTRRAFTESTTYSILLSTALKDRRRNQLSAPHQWMFSTGPELSPYSVSGKVKRVSRGSGGQVLIGVYAADADTLPDPRVVEPLAMTEADGEGNYNLPGLVQSTSPLLVYAMLDRDGNRSIFGSREFVSAKPETLSFEKGPKAKLNLQLIDPEAEGSLEGIIATASGDTTEVWVQLFDAVDDSLLVVRNEAPVDTTGQFLLKKVKPGTYRLISYCDFDNNQKRDPADGWILVLPEVIVPPGEKRELGSLPGPDCSPQ